MREARAVARQAGAGLEEGGGRVGQAGDSGALGEERVSSRPTSPYCPHGMEEGMVEGGQLVELNGGGAGNISGGEAAKLNGGNAVKQNGGEAMWINSEAVKQNKSEAVKQKCAEAVKQNGHEAVQQNGGESIKQNGGKAVRQNGGEDVKQNGGEAVIPNGGEAVIPNGVPPMERQDSFSHHHIGLLQIPSFRSNILGLSQETDSDAESIRSDTNTIKSPEEEDRRLPRGDGMSVSSLPCRSLLASNLI